MRNNKKVVELTETARALVEGNALPEPSWRSPFAKYASALNEVLKENDLGGDWDFDPDSKCFYREVYQGACVAGYRGTFKITVTLDPAKLQGVACAARAARRPARGPQAMTLCNEVTAAAADVARPAMPMVP